MDRKQLSMFKEWFADAFPDCRDYLELTYFNAEQNTFLSKCSYNPDSGNAAKVLRIAFGSWQHQQEKVEELQNQFDQHDKLLLQRNKDVQELYDINIKHVGEKAELQKRVDSLNQTVEELLEEMKYPTATFEEVIVCGVKMLEQELKGEG